jgi:hypothetical protein
MSPADCLLAFAACLAPASACAATPLSFNGAQLGISLAEWRSLAPPPGAGPDALPSCTDDPHVSTIAPNPLGATRRDSNVVTCAYVDRFGQMALPHAVRLDAAYSVDDLRYRFDHGRLVEIRFRASIDAFSDVMAMLKRQRGPPTATIRDEVRTPNGRSARVTEMWRTAGGAIMLVDPSDSLTQLEVSLSEPNIDAAAQPRSPTSR